MLKPFVTVATVEHIATITLNHPPTNLLSTDVLKELDHMTGELEADEDVRSPLAEGLLREAELFGGLGETADKKEGIDAFLERRPPKFQDQ